MKEFVEKLISRLEEIRKLHADLSQSVELTEEEQIVQSRFCGCFSKAKAIVNELAKEYNNGWIACSERLPKKLCEDVLAIDKENVMWIATYDTAFNEWYDDNYRRKLEIIAWQPLPQPYKAGD